MKSVMTHNFSNVPKAEIQRSSFNRSHGYKTAFDADYLIPVYVDEALPGDTFNLRMSAFARLATPVKPVMDNMFLESFFFAVPYRLVWENWERFNGAQDNPTDSVDFNVPHMHAPDFAAGGAAIGSLADYMGIPTGALNAANPGIQFNSLHFRAYNLIWNQWFRSEDLQDSVVVDVDDGPDTYTDYVLLKRCKRPDYFTSALPWPLKGGTDITLPLGDYAQIYGYGMHFDGTEDNDNYVQIYTDDTLTTLRRLDGTPTYVHGASTAGATTELRASLSLATASTINDLREAFQLQKMLERDARGGTRYTEIIRSHFNVVSPDARLQRAEYLGGGSTLINVHPVAQTGATAAGAPQGNLAAFGTASINNHGFTKSFTEHCLLIGLVNVRADITYQQGLNRMWSRQTRYDYYWPALAHLGEQSILNKEIYAQGLVGTTATDDEGIFGYQERYAEYRYKPSLITGIFRSTAASSLDVWHLSQEFSALPVLDDTFIASDTPIDRVIVTASEPHFLFDAFFDLKCARPMPLFGVPGWMDHF